jgi:hypothetical protein
MTIRPNSQNARILRALSDGRWHTVANIHRKAGTSRLNSRVSELRKQGYEIEHETVPEKTGSLGHKYRLLNPPSQTELATLVDLPLPDDWEERRAEVPRDETHRYRIYRMVYDVLDLLATATTAEDVGVALVTLGLEGEFDHSCVGLLDTRGTDAEKGVWVLNPWDTTP